MTHTRAELIKKMDIHLPEEEWILDLPNIFIDEIVKYYDYDIEIKAGKRHTVYSSVQLNNIYTMINAIRHTALVISDEQANYLRAKYL